MTNSISMKQAADAARDAPTERSTRPLGAAHRISSRWGLVGSLFLVLLMVASSVASATDVAGAPGAAPNLHLAPPVASGLFHASGHGTPKMPSHLPHSTPAAPHPAAAGPSYVENGSATFFSNVPIPNPTANTCAPYGYSLPYYYCDNTTNEPSLNLTTTGYTGLAYTAFTNTTVCAGQANWTYTEVGFVVSTNFGNSWSSPTYLDNPVCTGYPDQNYTSAFEPSLTSLPNGTFVLTYIEYNSSIASYGYDALPPTALACGSLKADRVVVTESYNGGVSWTTPLQVDGNQYNASVNSCPVKGFPDVRPEITASGDTLYLTWSNITNYLYYYDPYTSPFTAGVQFTTSTDNGSTWSAIKSLKTLKNSYNSHTTEYATDPSIVVSPSGEVFIAYATNYTGARYCGPQSCGTYPAASIELAISTNNGSTFSYTQPDRTAFADFPSWYPYTYWEPYTTIAYGAQNDQLYLAFSASAISNFCYNDGPYGVNCYQEQIDKVWFQNSSNNGTTWSTTSNPSAYNHTEDWNSPAYNPSFAVGVNGQIDLQYVELNESLCENITTTYYTSYYCAPLQDNYVTSDDNGSTWSNPLIVAGTYTYTYGPTRDWWDGFTSSTLDAGGQVLLGWTQVQCPNITLYGCQLPLFSTGRTSPANSVEVMTSRLFEGAGLTITFNETGLPVGLNWSVNIQGNLRDGPSGTNLSISGVPPGSAIGWSAPTLTNGYGVRYTPTFSVTPPSGFAASATVIVTYSEQVLVNVLTIPGGFYQEFWTYPYYGNVQMSPAPGPNWVTAGTPMTYSVSYIAYYNYCDACLNLTFLSWSGTGAGAVSTNSSSVTFTPTGPMNETASFQENGYCYGPYYITAYGLSGPCQNFTYALNFQEQGLPGGTNWGVTLSDPNASTATQSSSTSQVSFLVASGILGFQAWTVPSSTPGSFWVPTSSTTSPLALPQPSSVLISYTLESIGDAQFNTTFEESGLPNGTAWSLDLGGQTYGIRSSNGTFAIQGGGTPEVNGTPVYLSSGDGFYVSSISVTPYVVNETAYSLMPGQSISVNGSALVVLHFSPMYRVTVTGSVGGTVTPASQWVHLGQSVALGEAAALGFHFVDWSGTGPGSVSTGTTNPTVSPTGVVSEFATFRPNAPPTWNVTLTPLGLPAGTNFSVTIGGTTYSGNGTFKVGNLTQGDYALGVPVAYLNSSQTSRYVPSDISSTLLTAGVLDLIANGTVSITYTGQYALSIADTPGGTVAWGTGGTTGVYWINASSEVTFTATPDPHYYFVGWNGTGASSVTSTTPSISLDVLGPATETAQFQWRPNQPPATFALAVTQTGLPTGTTWSVAVGGLGASGASATLTVLGLNGSYQLSAPTLYTSPGVRWISNAVNLTESVTANGTFSVAYSEQFQVTVLGAVGGSVSPVGVEWVSPGTVVDLAAVANSTSLFLSWNGTGSGNYTGSSASTTVTVTGPITEQVAFGPQPVAQKTTSGGPGGGEVTALGLLVVLLVVGLVVGLLLGRRRSPPPMSEEEPAPLGEGPMDGSDEMGATPMPEYDEGPP
jgi:hypothetical protein